MGRLPLHFTDQALPGMPTPPAKREPYVPTDPEQWRMSGTVKLELSYKLNVWDLIMSDLQGFLYTFPEGMSIDNAYWFDEKVNRFITEVLDLNAEVWNTDTTGLAWEQGQYPEYSDNAKWSAGDLEAALVKAGVYSADEERARAES